MFKAISVKLELSPQECNLINSTALYYTVYVLSFIAYLCQRNSPNINSNDITSAEIHIPMYLLGSFHYYMHTKTHKGFQTCYIFRQAHVNYK